MAFDVRGVKYELGDELRDYIERRLAFALGRIGDRVDSVMVRLSDVNGPRGGVDKRCLIAVALRPRGVVRIEDSGHDPFALVARAARRVGQTVHRALGRQRRTRTAD